MASNEIRILHIMDKVSAGRSKMHGPARQIAYRVPYYPSNFKVMLLNLREEDVACDVLRQKGLEVVSLNSSKFNPFTLFDVMRVMREWKPTVLHLHGYASFNFGRVAGRLMKVPVVVQEHFVDERLPKYQQIIDWFLRNWQAKGLAVSEAVKGFMVDDRYMPDEQVEVLFNGIPLEKVTRATPEQIAALRQSLGIPSGAKVVGTAGRMAEMKGHHILLQAARLLSEKDSNLRFVLVGEGPWAETLRKQAADLGLADKAIFTGYQENVVPYISMFDVAVVASIFNEGFNTAGVEMLAVGAPLVITDMPCFHDIYFHEKNVLMVPPRDEKALANAIDRILKDPKLQEQLRSEGQKTAQECSIQQIAARYVTIYEDVCNA
jgi:glycosyltransferase involved in cell wall biosynthesis